MADMNLGNLYEQLGGWYGSRAGAESLPLIHQHLADLQQGLSGRDALYCGPQALFRDEAAQAGAIQYRFRMHPGREPGQLRGRPDALPIAANSLNLLALAHALDLSEHPHRVLREADRVLMGSGHLLLIGFNPWSWYGLCRGLALGRFPWNRHFYGLRRVRDWLAVLNFEVQECRYAAFRPPIQSRVLQRHMAKLEIQARWRVDHLGGVYCVLARKLRVPIVPLRERWYRREVLMPGIAGAKPTSRGMT